jgi:Ca2+/Na+ antiporter
MAKASRRTRQRAPVDATAFSAVRRYWWGLVVVLLLLHALVYAAFVVYQRSELHEDLTAAAEQAGGPGGDRYFNRDKDEPAENGKIADDVVVLRGPGDEAGFRHTRLGDDEYIEYSAKGIQVAIPTRETSEQEQKVLLVLAVLYVGELLTLFGWWTFVQRKVREVFTVS